MIIKEFKEPRINHNLRAKGPICLAVHPQVTKRTWSNQYMVSIVFLIEALHHLIKHSMKIEALVLKWTVTITWNKIWIIIKNNLEWLFWRISRKLTGLWLKLFLRISNLIKSSLTDYRQIWDLEGSMKRTLPLRWLNWWKKCTLPRNSELIIKKLANLLTIRMWN